MSTFQQKQQKRREQKAKRKCLDAVFFFVSQRVCNARPSSREGVGATLCCGVVQGCRAALCFIVSQIAARCASQELWLCLFIIMQHASWRDQIIKVVVVAQGRGGSRGSSKAGGVETSQRHLHNFVTWHEGHALFFRFVFFLKQAAKY